MRIIAGQWRGRRLEAPSGRATRPTADRVRETLFSMLSSRIGSFEGLRVADLFAGSGALGLEAMSRGAGSVTFLETAQDASQLIKDNARNLGAGEGAIVLTVSALALPRLQPFDLIFADPPYAPDSGTAVVGAVTRAQWLNRGGWMSVETARGEPVAPTGLILDAVRDVGAARLTLLRCP